MRGNHRPEWIGIGCSFALEYAFLRIHRFDGAPFGGMRQQSTMAWQGGIVSASGTSPSELLVGCGRPTLKAGWGTGEKEARA